jgi:adenylate kinase family enzyme
MTKRILARSAHSGRNDDNIETLKKRFAQFKNE